MNNAAVKTVRSAFFIYRRGQYREIVKPKAKSHPFFCFLSTIATMTRASDSRQNSPGFAFRVSRHSLNSHLPRPPQPRRLSPERRALRFERSHGAVARRIEAVPAVETHALDFPTDDSEVLSRVRACHPSSRTPSNTWALICPRSVSRRRSRRMVPFP